MVRPDSRQCPPVAERRDDTIESSKVDSTRWRGQLQQRIHQWQCCSWRDYGDWFLTRPLRIARLWRSFVCFCPESIGDGGWTRAIHGDAATRVLLARIGTRHNPTLREWARAAFASPSLLPRFCCLCHAFVQLCIPQRTPETNRRGHALSLVALLHRLVAQHLPDGSPTQGRIISRTLQSSSSNGLPVRGARLLGRWWWPAHDLPWPHTHHQDPVPSRRWSHTAQRFCHFALPGHPLGGESLLPAAASQNGTDLPSGLWRSTCYAIPFRMGLFWRRPTSQSQSVALSYPHQEQEMARWIAVCCLHVTVHSERRQRCQFGQRTKAHSGSYQVWFLILNF